MATEKKTANYRLGIALLGKGSTNHLHRREVVEAFQQRGISLSYLVRDDYINLLEKIEGCYYYPITFQELSGWREHVHFIFEYVRNLYPSHDEGRKAYFGLVTRYKRSKRLRRIDFIFRLMARYRWVVNSLLLLEEWVGLTDSVQGIEPAEIDQLMLLGIGTASSELEVDMTWWARHHKIPIVNIIGNYDNLSSKGFRGVPVDRLLVWGPNMTSDAIEFHGIAKEKITEIGSIRYNVNPQLLVADQKNFLHSLGLDPKKKTIMFAGFFFEFHYFEMMEVFKLLKEEDEGIQLILRIYPNKMLMDSVYMEPLLHYAEHNPDVYISYGDPDFQHGEKGKSVMQIEEFELCNILNSCDCVVNIFSTISLEACMYDKPAINMYYHQKPFPAIARTPIYYDYSKLFHNRRIVSYGAIQTARNRKELKGYIRKALKQPELLAEQRKATVKHEIGVLDGKACMRLVDSCIEHYGASS